MPKLAPVLEAMERQKNPPKSIESIVAANSEKIVSEIRSLSFASPEQLQLVLDTVNAGFREIARAIKAIPRTDLNPVLSGIEKNKVDLTPIVQAVSQAIAAIKMPVMPKPEKVDFAHVLQRIDHLSMKIDEIEIEYPEISVNVPKIEVEKEEPEEPSEWVFEIERNPSGFIKRVIAKEV